VIKQRKLGREIIYSGKMTMRDRVGVVVNEEMRVKLENQNLKNTYLYERLRNERRRKGIVSLS